MFLDILHASNVNKFIQAVEGSRIKRTGKSYLPSPGGAPDRVWHVRVLLKMI